jgi:hypothetical protein
MVQQPNLPTPTGLTPGQATTPAGLAALAGLCCAVPGCELVQPAGCAPPAKMQNTRVG